MDNDERKVVGMWAKMHCGVTVGWEVMASKVAAYEYE